MGCYDTYGKIRMQMKIGCDGMSDYSIGDRVPLEDGIYLGYGGAIVVKDGIFIAEFENIRDKWGNLMSCNDLIASNNPISKYLRL